MSDSLVWIVVGAIVVVVCALLVWGLLKARKGDGAPAKPLVADVPSTVPPPAAVDAPVEPMPVAVVAEVVEPPPLVVRPPAPPPREVKAARSPPSTPPAPVSPPFVAPPATPRPPPVVIERVLALEPADAAEWESAQPLSLLPAQEAAVAAAVAVRSGSAPLQRVVLEAGDATAIARGDQALMRAMGTAHGIAPRKGPATTWLDSSAATALVATALAALAGDRFLAGLGDEVRDLKAAIAALPPRLSALAGPTLKMLMQDLSRFTREARENYASAIGKLAFRERVGDAETRAVEHWRDAVTRVDGTRQQMQDLAALSRFGEVQVDKALALLRELQDQRTLQDVAARVLAAARLLRVSIGDAPTAAGHADAIVSALAALQVGQEQDIDLAARLAAAERVAKGDPYVGKAEFEANRAALKKALERVAASSPQPAREPLEAARNSMPLDPASGHARKLLVGPGDAAAGSAAVGLRWLEVS